MTTPEQPGGHPPPAPTPPPSAPSTSAALSVPDPSGPPSPEYPAAMEIGYPAELSRWLIFVKWLLAIPHWIALTFLFLGAMFVGLYAFFAVLFTARWPRGAFDYLVGTYRWLMRVTAYQQLMVDPYPPFSLADDPDHPVRVQIAYPDRIDRWRPLVQWLLAFPYLLVAGILYWLLGILTFISFFTILFTKQIPRGLFELMVPCLRWNLRGAAYAYFMTSRYPPFVWG